MRVTAKVDYAVRAVVVLAEAAIDGKGPIKGDEIARDQDIPLKFLENILSELRQAGIVASRRGSDGGYWLSRPVTEVTVADLIRAAEGPIATVRGERAEDLEYPPGTEALQGLWVAARAALRSVLEEVTVAQLVTGELPDSVRALVEDPDSWAPRWAMRATPDPGHISQ